MTNAFRSTAQLMCQSAAADTCTEEEACTQRERDDIGRWDCFFILLIFTYCVSFIQVMSHK